MKITLYFVNWNDSFYFPFIKEHYGKFCHRIVMFDNHSTDNSIELATELGFEIRKFGRPNELNDQHYLDVKNNCWKEERGKDVDYVIVCDADEFVQVPENMTCSMPSMDGFDMVSETLPEKSIWEVNTGFLNMNYAKQAIFCPNRIREINYIHGCHRNRAEGEITKHDDCQLFHFRLIGGHKRMVERHRAYRERMSQFNKMHGMGSHYLHTDEQKKVEFEHNKSISSPIWS